MFDPSEPVLAVDPLVKVYSAMVAALAMVAVKASAVAANSVLVLMLMMMLFWVFVEFDSTCEYRQLTQASDTKYKQNDHDNKL